MKWSFAGLAGLLTVLVVELHAPPADACGVPSVKVPKTSPRKVARTSNPSQVLVLGTPPRRLERDLAAAGHRVEVAPTVATAKQRSYAVVSVDPKQKDEARARFAGAIIIVRSGDIVADLRSVETNVARTPIDRDASRDVLAARARGKPLTVGPAKDDHRLLDQKPKDAEPEVAPPVAKIEMPDAPDPKPKAVKVAITSAPQSEVYFGLNSGKSTTASLSRAVRWLANNADLNVVIEGHADPSGSADLNMALSQKRAEWVKDFLVAAGIDQSRLEVMSFGDTRLKYSRTDPRNRRVELVKK